MFKRKEKLVRVERISVIKIFRWLKNNSYESISFKRYSNISNIELEYPNKISKINNDPARECKISNENILVALFEIEVSIKSCRKIGFICKLLEIIREP